VYFLGLDSLNCELKRDAYAVAHAESDSNVIRIIETSFELSEFTAEQFSVKAVFSLRVLLRSVPEPTKGHPSSPTVEFGIDEKLLGINATFTANFHCRGPFVTKNHATKFAVSESRLVFWPYFRQVVSDATSRMAIKPITVPLALKA